MSKYRVWSAIVLVAAALIAFFVYHTETTAGSSFAFRRGLDLSGGTLLTYHADVSRVDHANVADSMSALRDVIERRVNLFGVSEPIVQTQQSSAISGHTEQRLIVELPGVTNVEDAVAQIGKTPLLEFRLRNARFPELEKKTPEELQTIDLSRYYDATGLTGRYVARASVQFQSNQTQVVAEPTVLLEFNAEGKKRFDTITKQNVGKPLAIFLDGKPISEPVIREEIPDGRAVISGNFTADASKMLARDLNYGSLPVPISLIGTETVSASLGAQLLDSAIRAGLWGFAIVALFLILWYRLPGVIAVCALIVYVILNLAIYKLFGVTLTAAGIAGFILSIGMAVDANILIFERMKDELRHGKGLHTAITDGFSRAWLAIRDGNVTTILSSLILFWFGTSLIKGFALTLLIGVATSMFSAITVSRIFLNAIAPDTPNVMKRFLFNTPADTPEHL